MCWSLPSPCYIHTRSCVCGCLQEYGYGFKHDAGLKGLTQHTSIMKCRELFLLLVFVVHCDHVAEHVTMLKVCLCLTLMNDSKGIDLDSKDDSSMSL